MFSAPFLERRADREFYTGFWAGGPIRKNRLWFSSGLETSYDHGDSDPVNYPLPGALALQFSAPGSDAASLLQRFPSPAAGIDLLVANVSFSPTITIGRLLLLERLDYRSKTGYHRLMGRFALSRESQPDFVFSPYPGMSSGGVITGSSVAMEHVRTFRSGLGNDLRAAWSSNRQTLNRAHPEIPNLQAGGNVLLPSSQLLRGSQYRGSILELNDSVVRIRGRHVLTAGGGYEHTIISSSNSLGQTASFSFLTFSQFLADSPNGR